MMMMMMLFLLINVICIHVTDLDESKNLNSTVALSIKYQV